MILVCKDFEFDEQTLKQQNLSSVNFDDDTSLPSTIVREMESTTMNKYRPEVTGFGTTYTETLVFEIHITKDYEVNTSQEELELSTEEYEETVSWLTSPQEHRWLKITTQQEEVVKVKGYFS